MAVRLSILVPTRNEADNVAPLLARIDGCIERTGCEVIFVDDSDDATAQRIASAAERAAVEVVLIAREPGARVGGLGGAVVEGARAARGEWLCVMDGDLQHPPELIPVLLARAGEAGADLVLASRLAPGGSVAIMGGVRAALSRTLAWATARLFPERCAGVSDPMSGFFVVRRDALPLDRLRPDGFKILLEILVTSPDLRVAEVPFRFDARHAGRSKAGLREAVRLARTLARLGLGSRAGRPELRERS